MSEPGNAASRPIFGRILGECHVALWGLTSHERLRRQCAAIPSFAWLEAGASPPPGATVVVLRANQLYPQRTLQDLAARPGVVVVAGEQPVAAHVDAAQLPEAEALLLGTRKEAIPGLAVETPVSLSAGYIAKLLKADRPVVHTVRDSNSAVLEDLLFDGSYKGITDLVTKWLWPRPAQVFVRRCVALGIRPNTVTFTSVVLVFAALYLFAVGRFGLGLALAWFMTFLDTVDGKLARVTVDSSEVGHYMDKVTDIVHPPLWYIAWGAGAGGVASFADYPDWLGTGAGLLLLGYIGGRLLEGAFDFYLGKFPIYSWRPLDAYVRLIIARRNPNLILLTAAWIIGQPMWGFAAVMWWTLISTGFLVGRLAYAFSVRLSGGTIESWLRDSGIEGPNPSLAARLFATSTRAALRGHEG